MLRNLAVCLALLVCSLPAAAQAVCVPTAVGVPGNPGPPDWLGAVTPGQEGHLDPRWNGSLSVGHNDGQAHFRALRADVGPAHYLYTSLRVKTDAQGKDLSGANGDRVAIGFGRADRSLAYRITLRVDTSAAVNGGTIVYDEATHQWTGKLKVEAFEEWKAGAWHSYVVGSVPNTRPILPTWLRDDTRVYVTCAAGGCAVGTSFNVQVRIPVGGPPVDTSGAVTDASFNGGLEVNGDMVAYHRLASHFIVSTVPVLDETTTNYVWPNIPIGPGLPPQDKPDVSTWVAVSAGGPATCAGTIGFEGHQQIATGNTPPTDITATTTFHARPRNNSGANVNPSHLKATFRIADWGSTLFSSPQWRDMCASNPATTSTTPVPSGSELDLTCDATIDPCDYIPCPAHAPPTHSAHQCILAQLETAPAAPLLVFGREAWWNNMQMRESSVVEETAIVSTQGLRGLGAGRDVYLYVEQLNMPRVQTEVGTNGAAVGARPIEQPLDPDVAGMYARGRMSADALEARMPTYRVHVFHDTGVVAPEGARVLMPAPSFGYYLYHQGPFYGWRDELTAAGLVSLGGNLYKVHVDTDDSAKVKVHVESVESLTPPETTPPSCVEACGGGLWCELTCAVPFWWLIPIGLLVLIIFLVLLRRRQ